MIFEGVNFNEEQVKTMSREAFVALHENLLWQDREASIRKKMLGQVYDLTTKPAAKTKKKAENN